jgi:hypothetical protein
MAGRFLLLATGKKLIRIAIVVEAKHCRPRRWKNVIGWMGL